MKYRNRRVEVDGILFDSIKEAKRWKELRLLEDAEEIFLLRRQVPYRIEINGVLICKYIADFVYLSGQDVVCEDVKSSFTAKLPIFRIKKKLMKAVHGIEISII